jgi:hypothetical protein
MNSNKFKYKVILNYIAVSIIIVSNTFLFFPLTYKIIKETGGPMGYGLLILPFLIVFHLFLIPAFISLIKKSTISWTLVIINTIASLIVIAIYFNLFDNIHQY